MVKLPLRIQIHRRISQITPIIYPVFLIFPDLIPKVAPFDPRVDCGSLVPLIKIEVGHVGEAAAHAAFRGGVLAAETFGHGVYFVAGFFV